MDNFARQPNTERQAVFQESANQRGIRDIIIEKDFWVCWVLKRIYAIPELASSITFKGGTSLSKAYGLIDRFSEDIDLTIGRNAPFISDTGNPMEDDITGKERNRRIEALKQAAQAFVTQMALPLLQKEFTQSLGTGDGGQLVQDMYDPDGQTLLFYYPRVLNYGKGVGKGQPGVGLPGEGELGYIKPTVRLEFGARGETEPSEIRVITPYAAEDFPILFQSSAVSIATLSAERTFWEKVTILHALHHGSTMRDRMSRHYYDTFMMAEKGIADSALKMPKLLDQVVHNKSLMFRDAKASYDTAKIGSLKLLPTDAMLPQLQNDYAAMQEMFMADTPNFAGIIDVLTELERAVNMMSRS